MLRFVRTSTRPLFRSSLAHPSPITHLQPYNHSPYLRSFHPGNSLQYAKTIAKDDESGAIREKVENVGVEEVMSVEKLVPKGYEARESTEEHGLKKKVKPKIRKSAEEKEAKNQAALQLKEEIKEEKRQGREAKKYKAHLRLMKEKEAKVTAEKAALREVREEEAKRNKEEKVALNLQAEEKTEEKKEKAALRAKAKPRPTRGSKQQDKGKSEKKGIENDTEKVQSMEKADIEPGDVYRSEKEFLQSIGIYVPEKKKGGRKAKIASDPQALPTGEVEGTETDLIHEATKLSIDPEEKPLEHDIKLAKMPSLRSLARVSKPFEIDLSEKTKKLVEELDEIWQSTNPETGRKAKSHPRKRINIVSDELCDDILERMKPSLTKHMGCDILDLNPGSCVWSSKLHDFLKPRTHVLMEHDADIYDPYIQPLLNAPDSTYKLCAKSGLIWSELETVMNKDFFPFQESFSKEDPRLNEPNDSMLVLVNLAHHPKQGYRGFPNIAPLVLFQLMSAIGSHALFQRYGLVRMLIWVTDDEREAVLPRHITFRRKMTVENELSCTITEVTSSTRLAPVFRRDAAVDISATRKVLDKMAKLGIRTRPGRESIIQEHILNNPDNAEEVGDVLEVDRKGFRYLHELAVLEAKVEAGDGDVFESKAIPRPGALEKEEKGKSRLAILRNRQQFRDARKALLDGFLSRHRSLWREQAALQDVKGEGARRRREQLKELRLDLVHEIEGQVAKETRNKAFTLIDNARTMYTDHPLFQYDRREFEPLRVYKEEFYPRNVELSLLDVTPHALWPVLQKDYPKNLDIFQHILTVMFALPTQGVKQALLSLWPGAYEYLIHECPSLVDARAGGDPDLDLLSVRILPLQCFREIMEAWDRWPFRPSREDLLVHGSMWESEQDKEKALGKTG